MRRSSDSPRPVTHTPSGERESRVHYPQMATSPAPALTTAPVPPQNLDAEESVLGAMMLSPLAIGAVTESTNISAADFYRESHGHIYKAILALYAKGEPVDAITVVDELDRAANARFGWRRRARARARCARSGGVERVALRAHRQRDGDAARARFAPATTSRGSGSTGRARRSSSSTAPRRSCSTSRSSASRRSSRTSTIC